jgi:hypothetical protein
MAGISTTAPDGRTIWVDIDALLAACQLVVTAGEPIQRGERNGAVMGELSLALDAVRSAIAPNR